MIHHRGHRGVEMSDDVQLSRVPVARQGDVDPLRHESAALVEACGRVGRGRPIPMAEHELWGCQPHSVRLRGRKVGRKVPANEIRCLQVEPGRPLGAESFPGSAIRKRERHRHTTVDVRLDATRGLGPRGVESLNACTVERLE